MAETSPGARLLRPDGAALGDTPGTFGTLLLLGELGRGAFGRVYRAWEPTLARQVALKVVDLDDDSPSVAASVLEEGRLLARLRHPNIVTVHGAQQVGRHIGVWMELVAGRTLADIVATDGPMSADEAALVGTSLCLALGAVHGIGLVHRDIKAHNVMREAGGRIVLMDFGAGRDLASPALSHPGNVAGTPLYMAPERLMGQPATPASDLYSLGVLLYYLVTGRYPIETASLQDLVVAHAQRQFTPLVDARPDIGHAFARVVERALASEPRQRYPSAGAMLRDLGGETESWPRGSLDDTARSMVGSARARARRSEGGGVGRATRRATSAATRAARVDGRASTLWWGLAAVGLVLGPGVWALGFLSTMALNVSLGRLGRFGDESLVGHWVWGARSLISPVVQMAVMLLAVWIAVSIVRLVLKMSPRLADGATRTIARAVGRARGLGMLAPAVIAQWLLAAQLVALGAIVIAFRQLLGAIASEAAFAEVAVLDLLSQRASPVHLNYRTALFALLLASLLGWGALLRQKRASARPALSTTLAGLAVVLVTVLLMQIPYRLLWQADFERVDLTGTRCYETGRSGNQAMLFCPDAAPPRNPLVARDDPRLRYHGFIENVFTSAPRAVTPLPPTNKGSSP